MVVANVQQPNMQFVPKRTEPPRQGEKQSFESLMNQQTAKGDTAKVQQDKAHSDKLQDDKAQADGLQKAEEPQEKDKKTDRASEEQPSQSAAELALQLAAKMEGTAVINSEVLAADSVANRAQAAMETQQSVQGAQSLQTAQGAQVLQTQQTPQTLQAAQGAQTHENVLQPNGTKETSSVAQAFTDKATKGGATGAQEQSFMEKLQGSAQVKIPMAQMKGEAQKAENGSVTTKASGIEKQPETKKAPVEQGETSKTLQTSQENVTVAAQPQQAVQTLDPDKINFKVGEAVDTKSETFAKDFSDKIVYKINQDIKEFQIELNPQGMGRVSIKVEFAAGKAFVSLSCENAKTQTLLAQSSDTIRSIIQQNVGSETVVVVKEEAQAQNYQQPQQQHNPQEQEEQAHHSGTRQKPSDDSITFVNQLRLGLVDVKNL